MVQLFAKGETDFSRRGITIAAQKATVTFQDNGRYDLDMVVPISDRFSVDYGMILRASVPEQHIEAITLGSVSYYTANSSVDIVKTPPVTRRVSYNAWEWNKEYPVGAKVSYNPDNHGTKNYRAKTTITGGNTKYAPSALPQCWDEISGQTTTGGQKVVTIAAGTVVMKTNDFNSEWFECATVNGYSGFIRYSSVTASGESGERVIPAQVIREQNFVITEIEKTTDGKKLAIHAEHASYALSRSVLGECNLAGVNPATAIRLMVGSMLEAYPGNIYTNIENGTISADFSWKNAQSALLDPKNGLLQVSGARLIRNDLDVFVLEPGSENPTYRVTYGVNMSGVTWNGDVGDIVTRIYPTAQSEDGRTILLPEQYIDTVRTVPYVRPEVLNTGLKIGTKETSSTGIETVLTEEIVFQRMRDAANNRFNVDECDKASVSLELDWIHLPDTEEFAQYRSLLNAAPGEWVLVTAGPMGINSTIQMTGYVWDSVQDRYEKSTFGKNKTAPSVASYDLKNGSVNWSAIGICAVRGENIQAGAITAKEIAANSITSEKIATKSLTAEQIQAEAITADEIAANAITAAKIAAGAVTAEKIAAGTITAQQIAAGTITTVLLAADAVTADKIAANAISADKIAAGAVTAAKIDAGAITAEKLAAGAVTAGKIAAGTITADRVNAQDLNAWHATLHTARVDNGYINNADINYARIKDAALGTAIIDTSITEEGIANKLYINRLMITYGQMVSATIGDLVIGASDGKYYHVDVAWDENGEPYMVPTQVQTPSQAEIDAGRTAGGQTIIGNVGTFAELSSENFYAINSIIDRITAKRIDVDQLWAREAFVQKLMVQDISSNTYIQSTIGDWQGGSTITQTIGGINTRINQLGYGTFFYSTTPPDPAGVVVGDVWVEPIEDRTWDDVAEFTWDELGGMTWEQVAGQYRMYVWTGNDWKLLFDNMIVSELQTQINQNAYAITLKADESLVDTLSEEVTTFAATLEVQAEEISSAVSAVNAKTANYTSLTDPADDPSITLKIGDTWTKTTGGTWDSLAEFTWDDLADMTWDEIGGVQTFVWTGTGWLQTGDTGSQLNMKTLIDQTAEQIGLIAEKQLEIGDQVYRESARITVQSDRISQEVERATTAENGKIAKTSQYQTADEIVSEAVSQAATSAGNLYVKSTRIGQTANDIILEAVIQAGTAAGQNYIKKAGIYVDAESIKNEAVRVSGVNATNNFIQQDPLYKNVTEILAKAKSDAEGVAATAASGRVAITSQLTTADMILNNAVAAIDNVPIFDTSSSYNVGTVVVYEGAMYKFTTAHSPGAWNPSQAVKIGVGSSYIAQTNKYQTADAIVEEANGYVDGQLASYSTITQTSEAISAYVANHAYGIQSGIDITAEGIDISGSKHVIIASGSLFKVTSTGFGVDSTNANYVIWAGANAAANAPFRVAPNGRVYLTKLMIVDEHGQNPQEFNMSTNMWKLWYETIRSSTITTDSSGNCTSFQLSNGTTVNFKSAASVDFASETLWISGSKTFTLTNGKTKTVNIPDALDWQATYVPNGQMSVSALIGGKAISSGAMEDPGYSRGESAGRASVDFASEGLWISGNKTLTLTNSKTKTVNIPDALDWQATYVPNGQMSVSALIGGKAISSGAMEDPGYSRGESAGRASVDFASEGLWISGNKTLTLTNSKTKTVSIPNATDWAATYTTNGKMSVSAIVGGKAISSGEITDPGYTRGWDIGYAYANSEYTNLGNPGQLYVKNGNNYTAWQYPMTIYTK